MILYDLMLLLFFLFVLIKSADFASRFSSRIARKFHLSEFVVSFFIVAVISTFPEGTISIISALEGVPEFGLGTLLGSNIADLALVFGIIAIISANGVHVKSHILKRDFLYLGLLGFPVLLGLDGRFSRVDGILLVLAGIIFFLTLSIESKLFKKKLENISGRHLVHNIIFLLLSLAVLIVSANYAIKYGINFAEGLGIPPIIIGLTVISIGTCLPELLFSIRAVRTNHDELALGDLLGTVITDATIIIGITAIISPFSFNPLLIYVTGSAMVIAGALTVIFISSGKMLTRREGLYLLLFYMLYLIAELLVNRML